MPHFRYFPALIVSVFLGCSAIDSQDARTKAKLKERANPTPSIVGKIQICAGDDWEYRYKAVSSPVRMAWIGFGNPSHSPVNKKSLLTVCRQFEAGSKKVNGRPLKARFIGFFTVEGIELPIFRWYEEYGDICYATALYTNEKGFGIYLHLGYGTPRDPNIYPGIDLGVGGILAGLRELFQRNDWRTKNGQ